MPSSIAPPLDVAEKRTRALVELLVIIIVSIGTLTSLVRAVIHPEEALSDAPVVGATLLNFAIIFVLNRGRFHRFAAFLLCMGPVWLNLVEGLERPDGPIWYAFIPLTAILGGALLRFRDAIVITLLGVFSAAAVVLARSDAIPPERGLLIVFSVAVISAVALGMALFRARVEADRRAEVERLSAQLASTERLESIGRLAGGVAHDFNNLLTVILASAEVARDGQPDALDDIITASERAAALTGQLLAFSRHGGGGRIRVEVDPVIKIVKPLLRRLLPENIELALQLGTRGDGVIELEEQQLEQLLFNLSANARDAMPTGGRLTIITSCATIPSDAPAPRLPGEYVLMEVRDTGSGMDARTVKHAFEPFFSTKVVGQGTGLGLSTVHGIVRGAGGWLELESSIGRGTTLTVALPRSKAEPAVARTPVALKGRLSGNVLLVEDDPLVRRTSARILTELGLNVITAADPREVPAALDSAERIDLLITDVVMPGGSGVDLAIEIRARRPGLPVLLLSGYSEQDLRPALQHPSTRFLAKPFTVAALSEVLLELLPPRA